MTKKEEKKKQKRELIKKDKEWAKAIKERDKVCVICGQEEYVQAHHLISREVLILRHDLDNGILLCANHHKWSREVSPHSQPLLFTLWLQKHRPKQLNNLISKYYNDNKG